MKALFLDFDGLVCDTERAARRSWAELYDSLGHSFPPRVWRSMAGRSDGHLVAEADLTERVGRRPTGRELAWRARRKAELADTEPLRPGIAGLLAAARESGVRLSLVSSSPAAWVHPHLNRLAVHSYFTPVITGDDVGRHKPEPDLYLHALAVTGLAPGAVVAVEDSPTGVAAARAAGLRCVAVPTPADLDSAIPGATLVLASSTHLDLDLLAGVFP